LLEEVRPKLLQQLGEEAMEVGGGEAVAAGGRSRGTEKQITVKKKKRGRKSNRNPRAIAVIRIRPAN
jgi:hypothetical protein